MTKRGSYTQLFCYKHPVNITIFATFDQFLGGKYFGVIPRRVIKSRMPITQPANLAFFCGTLTYCRRISNDLVVLYEE